MIEYILLWFMIGAVAGLYGTKGSIEPKETLTICLLFTLLGPISWLIIFFVKARI